MRPLARQQCSCYQSVKHKIGVQETKAFEVSSLSKSAGKADSLTTLICNYLGCHCFDTPVFRPWYFDQWLTSSKLLTSKLKETVCRSGQWVPQQRWVVHFFRCQASAISGYCRLPSSQAFSHFLWLLTTWSWREMELWWMMLLVRPRTIHTGGRWPSDGERGSLQMGPPRSKAMQGLQSPDIKYSFATLILKHLVPSHCPFDQATVLSHAPSYFSEHVTSSIKQKADALSSVHPHEPHAHSHIFCIGMTAWWLPDLEVMRSEYRIVKWSNGVTQMLLGDEVLDLAELDNNGANQFLFVRHSHPVAFIQVRSDLDNSHNLKWDSKQRPWLVSC